MGYTESYSEIQSYKYCFLNDKNRVGITDDFGILGTIDEETDEQMDDEVEVDVDLVSVTTTADENEERSDDQVVSMEIGDVNSVTQFVGDNMDLNLVSIYGNSPFHTMGLIRVISPAPPSVDDRAIIRVKLKALDKAKILKATEVQILPFINRKQIGINAITFLPIAELSSSVMQVQPLLSPGDTLWTAEWVIKAQDSEFQHSNWNGWMKKIHADDAKQRTQVDFLPVIQSSKVTVMTTGLSLLLSKSACGSQGTRLL